MTFTPDPLAAAEIRYAAEKVCFEVEAAHATPGELVEQAVLLAEAEAQRPDLAAMSTVELVAHIARLEAAIAGEHQ